jgi:elongation factor G
MGQVHIETTVEKMQRKFGVAVDLQPPKVPYLETVRKSATGIQGRHKKQTGGAGQFGEIYVDLGPAERGRGFEFVDNVVGGSVPRNYIPAVEKGFHEAMERGYLAGYPVVDLKVRLYDGSSHPVDSSEMAFKTASYLAFKAGMAQADACLLEPVMHLAINVPEENMGDVMGDLNSRRGRVLGMETKGKSQIIKAAAPLAEILRYALDLRSMTSGRGEFTMKFSHYELVPDHIAQKIIEARKAEREHA